MNTVPLESEIPMKIVIVEDEVKTRDTIVRLVKQYYPYALILGLATTVKEAIDEIQRNKPDLILLDIKLPDGTGLDILQQVKNIRSKVIFVTAYKEYALDAINCQAVDYVLKPVDPLLFKQALKKAENFIRSRALMGYEENITFTNARVFQENRKVVLNTQQEISIINANEIVSFKGDGPYTTVNILNEEKKQVTKTLKSFEEELRSIGFFRSHKSYLINTNLIRRYDKKDGGIIHMVDGSNPFVSHRCKDELLRIITGKRPRYRKKILFDDDE